MSTTAAFAGECYACHRKREVQTRYSHAGKALCDQCAAKPHQPPRIHRGEALDKDPESKAKRRSKSMNGKASAAV